MNPGGGSGIGGKTVPGRRRRASRCSSSGAPPSVILATPSDHQVVPHPDRVRPRPLEGDNHPQVAAQVLQLALPSVQISRYQLIAVQTDPHHAYLRRAVLVDRHQVSQSARVDHLSPGRIQYRHSRLCPRTVGGPRPSAEARRPRCQRRRTARRGAGRIDPLRRGRGDLRRTGTRSPHRASSSITRAEGFGSSWYSRSVRKSAEERSVTIPTACVRFLGWVSLDKPHALPCR